MHTRMCCYPCYMLQDSNRQMYGFNDSRKALPFTGELYSTSAVPVPQFRTASDHKHRFLQKSICSHTELPIPLLLPHSADGVPGQYWAHNNNNL